MRRLNTFFGIAGMAFVMSGCPLSDRFTIASESGLAGTANVAKVMAGYGGERFGLGGGRTAEGGSQNLTVTDPQTEFPAAESGGSDALGGRDGLGGEEAAGGAPEIGIGGDDSNGGSDSLLGVGGAVGSSEAGASSVAVWGGSPSTDTTVEGGGRSNLGVGGKSLAGASANAGVSGASSNLIDNPGFENGTIGWSVFGVGATATMIASSAYAHSGTQSLLISGRTNDYEGPAYQLTGLVTPGGRYRVQLWLRLVSTYAYVATFYATVRTRCKDGSETYRRLASSTTASATRWSELYGTGTIATCTMSAVSDIVLYVEGPIGLSFYVDDVVFAPG